MSVRSYPEGFKRPLRESPVIDEQEHQAMLARLKRRCDDVKAKQSINQGPLETAACARGAELTATLSSNQADTISSGIEPAAPMPRGSLPNSLGGPGSGCGDFLECRQGSSLAPSAPALVWERISPYAIRTICGTWTCCKVMVGGYPRYELWRRIAGLERPVCVGLGMTAFLEAQDLAEAESCV